MTIPSAHHITIAVLLILFLKEQTATCPRFFWESGIWWVVFCWAVHSRLHLINILKRSNRFDITETVAPVVSSFWDGQTDVYVVSQPEPYQLCFLRYDVELFQRIEHLIGKKLPVFPTQDDEVMMLTERVTEAQRFARMVCNSLFIFGSAGFSSLHGLSLVAESQGCSLVATPGLLTVAASLVAEHRLYGARASAAVMHGL